jgi:hypothetical protein
MSYASSFEGRIIFGLEPIAKGLFNIYINLIGSNRFRFDRMEARLFLKLELEPSPTR